MGAIHSLTSKCLYIEKGKLLCFGESTEVVGLYLGDACAGASDLAGTGVNLDYFRPEYVIKEHKQEAKARYVRIWAQRAGRPVDTVNLENPLPVLRD